MIEVKVANNDIKIEAHGAIGDVADDVIQATIALVGMIEDYHKEIGRIVKDKIIAELAKGTRLDVQEMTVKEVEQ